MRKPVIAALLAFVAIAMAGAWYLTDAHAPFSEHDPQFEGPGDLSQGKLVFLAGECASCHATPGQPNRLKLGGGMALASPIATAKETVEDDIAAGCDSGSVAVRVDDESGDLIQDVAWHRTHRPSGRWVLCEHSSSPLSGLAALAPGFGCAFAIFGKVAASAAMLVLLLATGTFGLLLPLAVVILVALLARLRVLLVRSALVWHDDLRSFEGPRVPRCQTSHYSYCSVDGVTWHLTAPRSKRHSSLPN